MEREELERLSERMAGLSQAIDVASHELLALIREFDEEKGWHLFGATSCAQYLCWRLGMSERAARERVRVAHALAELPQTSVAMRRGELSYCKVRALTRVAEPDNEADLVEIALSSTGAQLDKICQLYRRAKTLSPEEALAQEAERWVMAKPTNEGMVRVVAQLRPEEAELVMSAIDAAASECPADALLALCAGEAVVPTVMLHVEAETLEGHTEKTATPIAPTTSRRLLCDASIAAVIEDSAGQVLDVGRKTRSIPPALRRAVQARDGGCRFPGCHHATTDAHHLEHWVNGGATKLDNLISLCRRHHRLVHECGFAVERGESGAIRVIDPNGEPIQIAKMAVPRDRTTLRIPDTIRWPGWDGTPPNYDWIAGSLN